MKYKEFLEYMEQNLDSYHTFMAKALQYQRSRNARRPAKSRWKDEKIEKASYEMWKVSMEPLYNNIRNEVKSDFTAAWIAFIDKNNIMEIVSDGIREMDFSEDAIA